MIHAHKNSLRFFTSGLYILLGVALGVGAMIIFTLETAPKEKRYPELSALAKKSTLTCDLVSTSHVGALNNCDEKKLVVNAEFSKPVLHEESMRLTDGPGSPGGPYKTASEVKIPQILWRREGDTIFVKKDYLLQELEDKQEEDRYMVTHESEKYLIASGVSESNLATESATVFLDKKEGLLSKTTSRSSLYCADSLISYSFLYRCH